MQDEFVPGVVDAVLQCGLSIPSDVAIATIGDDVVVTVEGQEVTAVHCDWEGFAQNAMDLMLKRIREPFGSRVRIVGSHELVPGGPSERFSGGTRAHTYMVTRRRRTVGSNSFVNK
jgi:DNA-binding LacI/PurR family transcriptional regulator